MMIIDMQHVLVTSNLINHNNATNKSEKICILVHSLYFVTPRHNFFEMREDLSGFVLDALVLFRRS